MLKSLNKKNETTSDLRALNFVVDAFNDLAQQFAKCLQIGQINDDDPYLTNLKVYRAYQDPEISYNNYINTYNAIFMAKNKDIEKFEDMQPKIEAALKSSQTSSPFTFPAYVKNRRTPITVTGLAIEIADINCANDNAKMDLFIDSKNWDFFANAARSFGFMIDMDVPWRLVADIGSSVMLSYASAYGASTTDEVIDQYFTDASYQYYIRYPNRMYEIYNFVKPDLIQFTEECSNGKTYLRGKTPKDYNSVEALTEEYGDDRFLTDYCVTRILEEENNLTENEINLLINDTIQLSKASTIGTALDAFEQIINKPFDNLGSLTYNINKRKLDKDNKLSSIIVAGY